VSARNALREYAERFGRRVARTERAMNGIHTRHYCRLQEPGSHSDRA